VPHHKKHALTHDEIDMIAFLSAGNWLFEFPGCQEIIRAVPGNGSYNYASRHVFDSLRMLGYINVMVTIRSTGGIVIAHAWHVNGVGVMAATQAVQAARQPTAHCIDPDWNSADHERSTAEAAKIAEVRV
jgi:hypothetical protein